MPVQFVLDRLFRRERLDHSMEEELRFHIAERAADLQRSGVPIAEAERRAQLEFGGMENYKEQCRETRRFHGIHGFFADLRFGFRILWRSPGFSILAILCLILGIGANAAVFSWVEGILFRPYPAVAHQERLFALTGMARGLPKSRAPRSASVTALRSVPGASYRRTILMPLGSIRFLAADSSRAKTPGAALIQ